MYRLSACGWIRKFLLFLACAGTIFSSRVAFSTCIPAGARQHNRKFAPFFRAGHNKTVHLPFYIMNAARSGGTSSREPAHISQRLKYSDTQLFTFMHVKKCKKTWANIWKFANKPLIFAPAKQEQRQFGKQVLKKFFNRFCEKFCNIENPDYLCSPFR